MQAGPVAKRLRIYQDPRSSWSPVPAGSQLADCGPTASFQRDHMRGTIDDGRSEVTIDTGSGGVRLIRN